jgi:site-specific recombinase XerD
MSSHVLPIELIAAGADGHDDAADWQVSAELASRYLLTFGESTRRAYGSDLLDLARHCRQVGIPPIRLDRDQLEFYAQTLETVRGLAPATAARRISAIRGYYKRAVEKKLLGESPMSLVKTPRVPQDSQKLGLSRDEVRALLDEAERTSDRAHLLVAALFYMGLRRSELLSATIADLGRQDGVRVLRVRRKGGARQTLPVAQPVLEALDRCIAGRTSGPLLATRTGRPVDGAAAARMLKRIGRQALPERTDLHPHLLRHSAATLALNAGATLRDCQDSLGHASADTTRRYDRARHALERNVTWKLVEHLAEVTLDTRPGCS